MSILKRNVWCVLGLPFDGITLTEAVEIVENRIKTSDSLFVSTPNLNFLITSQKGSAFFQSVIDSDLSVADGMPIIWMAKLLGIPLSERIAGSDLFDELSNQHGRNKKISVFFFGGVAGVAEQASTKLNESSAGMSCCGFYTPGFVSVEEMSTHTIIDLINEARPDFLLVALGAAKGQAWIQRNRHNLNAFVISHLGAVINFVAGHVERAPLFWQRCGMEWLWRIRKEPGLWRRYFFDGLALMRLISFKVFPLFFYDRWLKFWGILNSPVSISHENSDSCIIKLSGSLHFTVLEPVKVCFTDALQGEHVDVVLNCSNLQYIDSAFLGSLLLFQRCLNEQNRQLYLQNVSNRISCLMDLNNVLNRFQFMVDV